MSGTNLLAFGEEPSVVANAKDFGLTPLEKQVLGLVLAGYTSKESAQRTGVSEHRLRQHLRDIIAKLRVANRFELVLFALHHHLTDPIQIFPRVTEKRLSQTPRPKQAD